MDFTREPIIETVIIPKEGCKLVVRCSNAAVQEEYFVDAVELVTFGTSQFFRSLERPKPFLLPVSEFEVLEVREPRVVLKHVGTDRSIKIGSGKQVKKESEASQQKKETEKTEKAESSEEGKKSESRKKRRPLRRKKKSEAKEDGETEELPKEEQPKEEKQEAEKTAEEKQVTRTYLAPPPTLISETLAKYREDDTYKAAFYEEGVEGEEQVEAEDLSTGNLVEEDVDFDASDAVLFQGSEESEESSLQEVAPFVETEEKQKKEEIEVSAKTESEVILHTEVEDTSSPET